MDVIPQFGVDPDLFCSADAEPPARPFTVGYAGRLVEQKGVMLLVEAMAGAGDWRLLLCGQGPLRAPIEARLASWACESGWNSADRWPRRRCRTNSGAWTCWCCPP